MSVFDNCFVDAFSCSGCRHYLSLSNGAAGAPGKRIGYCNQVEWNTKLFKTWRTGFAIFWLQSITPGIA
ncbi:MAG TPA: hypothetical protein DHW79_07320 [Candidatus Cloacimonas sp.]|nr:hypothetical protein [Candidatus Cloacimonas sp.]